MEMRRQLNAEWMQLSDIADKILSANTPNQRDKNSFKSKIAEWKQKAKEGGGAITRVPDKEAITWKPAQVQAFTRDAPQNKASALWANIVHRFASGNNQGKRQKLVRIAEAIKRAGLNEMTQSGWPPGHAWRYALSRKPTKSQTVVSYIASMARPIEYGGAGATDLLQVAERFLVPYGDARAAATSYVNRGNPPDATARFRIPPTYETKRPNSPNRRRGNNEPPAVLELLRELGPRPPTNQRLIAKRPDDPQKLPAWREQLKRERELHSLSDANLLRDRTARMRASVAENEAAVNGVRQMRGRKLLSGHALKAIERFRGTHERRQQIASDQKRLSELEKPRAKRKRRGVPEPVAAATAASSSGWAPLTDRIISEWRPANTFDRRFTRYNPNVADALRRGWGVAENRIDGLLNITLSPQQKMQMALAEANRQGKVKISKRGRQELNKIRKRQEEMGAYGELALLEETRGERRSERGAPRWSRQSMSAFVEGNGNWSERASNSWESQSSESQSSESNANSSGQAKDLWQRLRNSGKTKSERVNTDRAGASVHRPRQPRKELQPWRANDAGGEEFHWRTVLKNMAGSLPTS